jgi:hypothetical protein
MHQDSRTTTIIRRLLLTTLVMGLIGTEAELLLLKHTEGFYQLLPVALIAVALMCLAWYGISKSAASLRLIQGLMIVFLVSGVAGAVLHYIRNIADARESDPSLSGNALYVAATMGSTPALAPGTMIQLALIGLAFAFRHPALGGRPDSPSPTPSSSS